MVARWRLALRLARRDARRSRGRSMLVVSLIGLPILVLGVADIGYRTYQLSPDETLARTIGAADLGVQWSQLSTVVQGYAGWLGDVGGGDADDPAPPTAAQVARLLPAGSRILQRRTGTDLVFHTQAGLATTGLVGLDYTDPLARGLVRPLAGRAPRTRAEIAVTPALAAATGARLGTAVHALNPARVLHVVGVVADADDQRSRTAYTVPGAVGYDAAQVTWLVGTPHPVRWAQVRALNAHGLVAISRAEYLHPSAAARASTSDGPRGSTIAELTLVVGMALLEVVLLAGPAFAVGAKRRRRDLALASAAGASPRDIRRIVLCSGVALGAVAGVVGVLAAIGVAAAGLPLLLPHVARLPGNFDVHPLDLLALSGVALLAAVAAAVFPARAAARNDVVAGLAGRRGDLRIRRRVPVAGLVLAALGVAVALTATARNGASGELPILAGVALLELGLLAATPALLAGLAHLGRRLPLAPRLALRDAGRNRSAAAPAVAAVLASVIGAVALLVGEHSGQARDRAAYRPSLPTDLAVVQLGQLRANADPDDLADQLQTALPASAAAVVRDAGGCLRGAGRCHEVDIQVTDLQAPSRTDGLGSYLTDRMVVDPALLGALFGERLPAATAAMRAGKVVVVDRNLVHDGTVSVQIGALHDDGTGGRRVELPAVAVTTGFPIARLLISPATADRLGLPSAPDSVVVALRRAPTDAQLQAATAAIRQVRPDGSLIIEDGWHSGSAVLEYVFLAAAVLLAVLAAVIATGLANADAMPDLGTLGAIGASPRIRRLLSGWRAGAIAGVGSVFGAAAGLVVPVAWVLQDHRADRTSTLHVTVPWSQLALLVAGVPMLAATVAALVTSSRLPSGAPG